MNPQHAAPKAAPQDVLVSDERFVPEFQSDAEPVFCNIATLALPTSRSTRSPRCQLPAGTSSRAS